MFGTLLSVAGVVLRRLLIAALSEKFLMKLVIRVGDWLVASTTNTLKDDEIWKDYKESLNAQVKENK